jgi:hypothetical protein
MFERGCGKRDSGILHFLVLPAKRSIIDVTILDVHCKIQRSREPATALHLADVERLLESLNNLMDVGHTVLSIGASSGR